MSQNLLLNRLSTLKRPLHTRAHGDHKYDLCPTCLATIDKRSVEVEFPPFGKLELGNLGTSARNTMSNRRLTLFERLSIDTEVKRNESEHSYINSTQVKVILEFLGIKHEGSDLENYKYDYGSSADGIVSIDDLTPEKGPKDDMLININLHYNTWKIRFNESERDVREHRKSRTSEAYGEMYLKALENSGIETKEQRRQETMLAIKQVLQPANDPIIYAPFFEKKPTHNTKNRLRRQQTKNEIQNQSVLYKTSNEQISLEDVILDTF